MLDAGLRIALTNTRLRRLTGLSEPMLRVGVGFAEVLDLLDREGTLEIDGSTADSVARMLAGHFSSNLPFRFEIRRPAGRILMVRANPLSGSSGWVCVFTDVTAERNAAAALSESEDRYRRLIETSPDMVAIQRDGRFVYVNIAGARLLGAASPAQLIGRRVLEFVHPDDHRTARESRPSTGAEDVHTYEMRGLKLDGTPFEFETTGFEFTYQGKPATLVFIRDVTERKQAQAQLVQTSKLALLGEMAASIAHELNQPLNIIRMAADSSLILMEEGRSVPGSHRVEFERISAQTERMAAIINHMRVFSRREEGRAELFDPVDCVRNAIGLVHDQYRLDGVVVREDLPPASALVRGQPIRLEQVILNLLANARDAIKDAVAAPSRDGTMPAQPGESVIEVHAFLAGNGGGHPRHARAEVVIVIGDSGGGIPSDLLDRIFDPFFTTKQVGKGTGLGLAIGYSIISGMNGTITASNGHKGAIFEIRLPIADAAARGETPHTGENPREAAKG